MKRGGAGDAKKIVAFFDRLLKKTGTQELVKTEIRAWVMGSEVDSKCHLVFEPKDNANGCRLEAS